MAKSAKRKRIRLELSDSVDSDSDTERPTRPVSAFAAARERFRLAFLDTGEGPPQKYPPTQATSDIEYDSDTPVFGDPSEFRKSLRNASQIGRDKNKHYELYSYVVNPIDVQSSSNKQITIVLEVGETIAPLGIYDFAVLQGLVLINGARIEGGGQYSDTTAYRVFASSTHSIPVIQGLDGVSHVQLLSCDLSSLRSFEKLSPLYSKIWNFRSKNEQSRSFTLVRHSKDDELKRFLAPVSHHSEWQNSLNSFWQSSGPSPRVMVTGPKSCGKSTYAKMVTNTLISRKVIELHTHAQWDDIAGVFYLDLDSSAPEYTPPGQISLVLVKELNFGPPFTHSSPVASSQSSNRSHLVWSHSLPPRGFDEFSSYFYACVSDLYNRYRSLQTEASSLPLVINTPAWEHLGGLEVLLKSIDQCQSLTHVVHLARFPSPEFKQQVKARAERVGAQVYTLPSNTKFNVSRKDFELRSMHLLSYFHSTGIVNKRPLQRTYSTKPLSCMIPWEIYYGPDPSRKQGFNGILMLNEWVDAKYHLTVLNGALIQIVLSTSPTIRQQYRQLPRSPGLGTSYFDKSPRGMVEPLDPQTSRLLCTALIRGFKPKDHIIQLLIPKTHEDILYGLDPSKLVFVFGCLEHPEWAYLEDAYFDLSERQKEQRRWEKSGEYAQDGEDGETWEGEEGGIGSVGISMPELGIKLPPWVTTGEEIAKLKELNMVRRVRKFQQ